MKAVAEVIEIVRVEAFLAGSTEHVEGLAGYVRDFLKAHKGAVNESGRLWTAESCADALKIPPRTLRRWMGADQGKPTAITREVNRERVARSRTRSTTRAVLRDPEERRAVIRSLPPEGRDELRAELVDVDEPKAVKCRHCPTHCPGDTQRRTVV
jgi:hypothetical protein